MLAWDLTLRTGPPGTGAWEQLQCLWAYSDAAEKVAAQFQAGGGPWLRGQTGWLRRGAGAVRACLQVAHGAAYELEPTAGVPGALVGRVACRRQRHL